MARDMVPVLKRCRSLGLDPIYLGVDKKSNRQSIRGNKKKSEYGLQLTEKQKAKFIYGVLEKPFRNYFEKAKKLEGPAGENLIVMLEQRFDNVVFRAGFGKTRRECRQMVVHNHFTINGKKANIPSMQVKVGDVIQMKEKSANSPHFKEFLANQDLAHIPSWMELDAANHSVKIVAVPKREEIDIPVNEQMIVELYNK